MMIKPEVRDFIDGLQSVADTISVDAALAISKHFGGTRLHVPMVWRADSNVNAIGEIDAKRLCGLFGGLRMDVPKSPFTKRALKQFIDELQRQNMTNNEIARELDLSWRRVVTLSSIGSQYFPEMKRRKTSRDPRQIDLEEWIESRERCE